MAGKKDTVKDQDRFSIITDDLSHCYFCGIDQRICLHEAFHGTANRKKSKEDGLIFPICFEHHQGTLGVHNNPELDNKLKQYAQKVWMSAYCDKEDIEEERIKKFIKRYGKNYID